MINIGGVIIPGPLALAPMAGVTDTAFRGVCRRLGADLSCTEMVSAKALVYKDEKTRSLLQIGGAERPAAAQIFGSEPDTMERAAGLARELSGADIIDINMGCPVGKVVKSGDGSALMRDPDKAFKIIEAAVRGAGAPVTVKFRKGWDKGSVNAIDFGLMCRQAGASAITVHGRTRTQMYSGLADWDVIREVKRAVTGIPVFCNGDIFEPGDVLRALSYTGCDGVMIGRGALGNPWLFLRAKALLDGKPDPGLPPLSERLDTALSQIETAAQAKGEYLACLEARRHFAWYLWGVPHSAAYKAEIVRVSSLEELRRIAARIKREHK
jgi:nifR3 family TIM-barrel protein